MEFISIVTIFAFKIEKHMKKNENVEKKIQQKCP